MPREARGHGRQPRAGLPAHEKPGVAATAWINLRSRHGASRSHQRPAGYTNDCVTHHIDQVGSIGRGKGTQTLTRMAGKRGQIDSRSPSDHHGPASRDVGGRKWESKKAVALLSQVTAFLNCAPEGTRTPNLLIRSQMLYPLSYGRSVR
jgi:hypothetical protein